MVSLSSLTTDAWDVMYNHLQTGDYALSTDNIFSAYNDELIADKGLPIVVIYPPAISISKVDTHGDLLRAPISYTIEIYHKTSQSCKSLVDELQNKLITGYNVFASAKLKRVKENWFSTIDYTSWTLNDRHRVHRYTIEVNYTYVER